MPSEPAVRYGEARWEAEVISAEGVELAEGTACTIAGNARHLRFARFRDQRVTLRVTCDGQTIYDWQAAAEGDATRDCELFEQAQPTHRVLYWLRCHDRGVRSGRPELELDTVDGTARVFRSDGTLDVRLDVARASAPVAGRLGRSFQPPPVVGAVERTAVVAEVMGEGAREGEACTVTVEPRGTSPSRSGNCRVRVRCGRRFLYGAGTSGWNVCEVDDELAPVGARDPRADDGDPTLDLDLRAGTLRIGDVRGERSERIELTLEPVSP